MYDPFLHDALSKELTCASIHCINCLISDDPHIGISWSMILTVDFLQFEGHLSVIEVKHKMRIGAMHTHEHYFNQLNGFD